MSWTLSGSGSLVQRIVSILWSSVVPLFGATLVRCVSNDDDKILVQLIWSHMMTIIIIIRSFRRLYSSIVCLPGFMCALKRNQ